MTVYFLKVSLLLTQFHSLVWFMFPFCNEAVYEPKVAKSPQEMETQTPHFQSQQPPHFDYFLHITRFAWCFQVSTYQNICRP